MGANHALRGERQKRGWSQAVVAEKLDTSAKNVSRWECGSTSPSPYFRVRLCQLFGVDAKALGLLEQRMETLALTPDSTTTPLFDPEIPRLTIATGQIIGRSKLIEQMLALLKSETICTLYGLPGVGKSTLAHVVSMHPINRESFPDGVLWIRLGPTPDVHSELMRLAHLLQAPSEVLQPTHDNEYLSQSVRQLLRERRMLIVIDDAWTVEVVLPFLIGGTHTCHLVTTRLPELAFGLPLARALAVPELDEEWGQELLTTLVPALASHSEEAIQKLSRSVGGLPLALTLVGHYLRTQAIGGQRRRLNGALQQLVDSAHRLHVTMPLETGGYPSNTHKRSYWSLAKVIDISNDHLSADAQVALYALSVLPAKPERFSETVALAVTRQPVEVLDQLLDAGLLEGASEGWYYVHQAIADYARLHLHSSEPAERLIDYAVRYSQERRSIEALVAEHPTLLAALHVPDAGQRAQEQLLLAHLLTRFWLVQGRLILAEQELQQMLVAARRCADKAGTIQMLSDLAQVAIAQGDEQSAEHLLIEAERLAREQGSPIMLYDVLNNVGGLHYARGNLKAAELAYQETFQLARQMDNPAHTSRALNNLGIIAVAHGRLDEGICYWQAQLEQDRQQQNLVGICHVQANLGRVFAHRLGYQEQAHEALQEALELAEQLEFQGERSDIRYWLAELARGDGRFEQAETLIEEGLEIAQQGGQRREIILLLEQAIYLARDRGKIKEMETKLIEAEERIQQLNNPFITAIIQQCRGYFHLTCSQFVQAAATFESACQAFEQQGETEFGACSAFGLAQAMDAQGSLEEAQRWGEQSLAWFSEVHHMEVPHVRAWLEKLTRHEERNV